MDNCSNISPPERSSLPITQIVRAIYNFQGENNDELCIKKDDLITLTQTPEGGWYEGTLDGVTGWFPSNYVEAVDGEVVIVQHQDLSQEALVQLPDKTNSQQYRKLVIKEITDTETAYLQELKETYQQYLLPLLKSVILPEKEVSAILDAFIEVIKVHNQFLTVLETLQNESDKNRKIGGAFMAFAPKVKIVHLNYCALHPHFVSVIEKNKDVVSAFMKKITGSEASNGSVILTSSLSYSFRRLDKYPALLQELQRYTDECHPDRGDTQRAGFLYRDLVSAALELRRRKEMELEVMLGNIRGWPSDELGPVEGLGPIVLMGPTTVLFSPSEGKEVMKDRYLVLFEHNLLLLSVSNEMTSFTFEYNLPLEEMTVPRLPEVQSTKNTFELLVPSLSSESTDRFIFQCASVEEVRNWISVMLKCKASAEKSTSSLKRSCTGSLRKRLDGNEQQPQHHQHHQQQQTPQHQMQHQDATSTGSSRRQTVLTMSESSSQSSGSSLNFAKGSSPSQQKMNQETRSSYWANKSLLPHPPVRSSLGAGSGASLENGIKSSSAATTPSNAAGLSVREDRWRRPSSPSDDMAILQVIESYYFTGKKNQAPPPPGLPSNTTGGGNSPQILLVDDENIAIEAPATAGLDHLEDRTLVGTVNVLVEEVRQMRAEIDSLADCMRRERKARKRLKHFVGRLASDGVSEAAAAVDA